MESRISATELARRLGDILGRIRYRGDTFVVERNGEAVARITPLAVQAAGSLRDGLRAWASTNGDVGPLADDLERVNRADRALIEIIPAGVHRCSSVASESGMWGRCANSDNSAHFVSAVPARPCRGRRVRPATVCDAIEVSKLAHRPRSRIQERSEVARKAVQERWRRWREEKARGE